jgi:(E)-4-hydroxy-3-methylbut-2-enyl-diphosphate synthase
MTTTRTQDVDATVAQAIRLIESGCEIVRITAPTVQDARAIGEIRAALRARGFTTPLVADIHFSPAAALEAANHVEKVRINPGNYADSRKFAVRTYSDAEYEAELHRIEERFAPLVLKCKSLGIAMRIGTNHGSLSDRIVNRYGDTPEGMAESALEFVRICERNDYHSIIMSMKASNPKVMIAAYRLLAARMEAEGMAYPFHLGVTEAGNGEDARIKSAVGIGALLQDGIGDTIRVSLAEEPEAEIPVAQALAARYWPAPPRDLGASPTEKDVVARAPELDPYHYGRRASSVTRLGAVEIGVGHPPAVFGDLPDLASDYDAAAKRVFRWSRKVGKRAPQPDVAIVNIAGHDDIEALRRLKHQVSGTVAEHLPILGRVTAPECLADLVDIIDGVVLPHASEGAVDALMALKSGVRVWLEYAYGSDDLRALVATNEATSNALARLHAAGHQGNVVVKSADSSALVHGCRDLAARLADGRAWTDRNGDAPTMHLVFDTSGLMLEKAVMSASVALGSLLCDGIGDSVAIAELDAEESVRVAFAVLQGSGARLSRTDYVACPSCGRTLFDLQSTTDRIKQRTSHLKGVKLAIMGCVVNGPGEMADADFGYVGGSPGHVNLYVGKECVERNVPEADADERLVRLIRDHGRWMEPEA